MRQVSEESKSLPRSFSGSLSLHFPTFSKRGEESALRAAEEEEEEECLALCYTVTCHILRLNYQSHPQQPVLGGWLLVLPCRRRHRRCLLPACRLHGRRS